MRTLICFCLFAAFAFPQEPQQDAEGCKDTPLIDRFPGSHIESCEHKEYEAHSIPVGRDNNNGEIDKDLEGDYYYYRYVTRPGLSSIQLYRNYEAALKKAGYQIIYTESPQYLAAVKGPQYIYLNMFPEYYDVYTLKVQAMKQEVAADATAMGNEIDTSGHVAVYGIHFDTGKASIQPDSEATLAQVKELLAGRPDLKLRVEGHTDNVGDRAANQKLSQARAAAVVAWLAAHGIDKSRLTAQGFADTKPVDDNGTEDGRAKNRRVELVKM